MKQATAYPDKHIRAVDDLPPKRSTPQLAAGVTLNAVNAIKDGQQTFTRDQAAYLVALAYETGRLHGAAENIAEVADCWREFAQPQATREQRIASRHAEMEAGTERERRRREAQPTLIRLTVDWPPVAVPGTVDPTTLTTVWPCPCRRRTERHWLDGYHRTPEPFPVPQVQRQHMREAA